jgi:hypothetical protein
MITLYFIYPDAQINVCTVSAVESGAPLTYGAAYEVEDALATDLLANIGDWSDTEPVQGLAAPPPQPEA